MHVRNAREPKSKPAVVEFSNLTQNNKAQFLEFLLKNNITFQKGSETGKGDYVAKVIIQKPDQNKQNIVKSERLKPKTNGKQDIKKTKYKSMMDSQKSVKVNTPIKQQSKEIQRQPSSSFKNVEVKQQVSSNLNSKNQKKMIKTIKITEFLAKDNKIDFNNSNFKYKQLQNDSRTTNKYELKRLNDQRNKQNNYNDTSQSKQKRISVKAREYSKSPSWTKKETIQKHNEKISEINNQVRKKTEEQKQIFELVNKYLKIFDMRLSGQRPIRWPALQLQRAIEEIYNQLFIKTTQSLTQKGVVFKQLQNTSQSFVKFIKQWYASKYKNEKLANSNLFNLLYSLSFYLENQKKLVNLPKSYVREVKINQRMTFSGSFMQTFQDFISEIYQFDDLLFFLFIRNITLSQASKQSKTKDKSKIDFHQKDLKLNYKEFVQILNIILDGDTELIEEYKIMILTRLNSKTDQQDRQAGLEQEIRISGLDFMLILVQNYHTKRLLNHQIPAFQPKSATKKVQASKTSSMKFENANQALNLPCEQEVETEELTFGEETQQNLQKFMDYQMSKDFWKVEDQTTILNAFAQGSLESLIKDKMERKVTEFVNILIENRSEYNSIESKKLGHGDTMGVLQKKYIKDLFMKKSRNLLGCIVEMNKLKWFQQLKLKDPAPEDIEKVENLQLAYRKLKSQPDSQKIGKLCKNILTVSQLTFALEKLICQ